MQEIIQLHRAFNHIRYYDQDHTYIDTNTGAQLISCTTFIKKFQQEFKKEYWLKKKAKEYQISPEQLDDQWSRDSNTGKTRGTLLHKFLENLWCGKEYPIEYPKFIHTLNSLEFITFHKTFERLKGFAENFVQDYSHLVPVKLEVVLGDSDLGIAGQCDVLFWDTEKECLVLADYKSDKRIDIANQYQNMKKPLTHLSDCNYNKYTVQLSVYRYLIEKNTDLKIGYNMIVWFQAKNDNYEVIEVPYLEQEMKTIFTK